MVDNLDSTDLPVTMAKIGKPQGIKGWVRIHSFTEPKSNIGNYRIFHTRLESTSTEIEMDQIKQQGNVLVAHFKGFDLPEQSQELVGLELKVRKADLPILKTGEFYWHQLQGLNVVNLEDQNLGVVAKLMETGANDVLVVSASENSIDQIERLIPYLPDLVVKNIDLKQKIIKVEWEADYLL